LKAYEIKLKLYLEGVLMPLSSITINESIGAAPTAIITMPASTKLGKLHPKTLAHVFYKKKFPWETGEEKYYLIFEGELNSLGWSQRNNGNSISLNFVGLTSNWKRTYKTIVDFSLDTFQTGKFLLVSDSPNSKLKYSPTNVPDKVKAEDVADKKQSNLLLGTVPGSTIISRLEQTINKFFNSNSKTPVKDTIESFLNDLADSNPYYFRIQDVYNILDRLAVLENSEMKNNLKGAALSEIFRQAIQNLPSSADGSLLIKTILDRMEYFYAEPSAPTLGADGKPKSIIFSPETLSMIPLRCNTFFPSEISTANFSQNFDGEPTRYVVSTPPLSVANTSIGSAFSLRSKFIVPRNEINYITKGDKKGLPALGFTQEEFIRGVNPGMGQYSEAELGYVSFIRDTTQKKTKTDKTTETAIQKNMRQSSYGNYIRTVAKFKYLKTRLSTRQYSIMVPYNPVRIVGLPALVINENVPNVVGKLAAISSTISAEGQGTSSITLQYPRTINDFSFPNDNTKKPWEDGTFDLFTDEWPQTPFWISDSEYGRDSIGETMKALTSPTQDNSVVINYHNNKKLPSTGDENRDTINDVAKSINEIKKKYKIYDDKYIYVDAETRRDLVDEASFWNFYLNGNTLENSHESIDKMSYSASTRVLEYDNTKPFVSERRNRVLLAKEDLNA
jgi:hypothetical protein